MDKIELTKDELQAALLRWTQAARDGNWPAPDGLSAEQVAQDSAEFLWGLLTEKTTV